MPRNKTVVYIFYLPYYQPLHIIRSHTNVGLTLLLLWERKSIKWSCYVYLFFIFSLIFISWRLITLQYCSGFCHTLTWISHGFTCIPHPDPHSHLPLHPIPLGLPSAPGPSTCLMHPTWAGDLFNIQYKVNLF